MKIGLLVYPGCMPAGLFAAADHFRATNQRLGKPAFELVWIGAGAAGISLPGGPVLAMDRTLEEPCEAYLLPGFWAEKVSDIDAMIARQPLLIAWLRQLPASTALWTYCMGAALLAAAGKLDRRNATTTWWLEQALRLRFPAVRWDFGQTVIEDRHIITAAGASGYWAVLSKLLLSRIPPAVIRDVEQAMLVPRSNSGHPVFRPVELFAQAEPQLQRLIVYAQKMPAAALNLDGAASFLAISSRTLSRKIDQHARMGAGEWLRLVKLRQVSHALLSTTAPLKTIGAEFGFTDEASLMRAFKKATGLTISQYRQQYGHSITSFADSLV